MRSAPPLLLIWSLRPEVDASSCKEGIESGKFNLDDLYSEAVEESQRQWKAPKPQSRSLDRIPLASPRQRPVERILIDLLTLRSGAHGHAPVLCHWHRVYHTMTEAAPAGPPPPAAAAAAAGPGAAARKGKKILRCWNCGEEGHRKLFILLINALFNGC